METKRWDIQEELVMRGPHIAGKLMEETFSQPLIKDFCKIFALRNSVPTLGCREIFVFRWLMTSLHSSVIMEGTFTLIAGNSR